MFMHHYSASADAVMVERAGNGFIIRTSSARKAGDAEFGDVKVAESSDTLAAIVGAWGEGLEEAARRKNAPPSEYKVFAPVPVRDDAGIA